ncbi:flagellar assembly protein FliW [candidate division KSB1 bacterium]
MRIETTRFGEIEFQETDIVHLPHGLVGFNQFLRYIIIPHSENSPLFWLQSVDDPGLAFVITDPLMFRPDYQVKLEVADAQLLGIDDTSKAVIYAIVVIPKDPQEMTANLMGPLVVNPETRMGKQIIMQDSPYTTRHYILEEMKQAYSSPVSDKT